VITGQAEPGARASGGAVDRAPVVATLHAAGRWAASHAFVTKLAANGAALWSARTAPLASLRAQTLLHAGAAALAAGLVAGLYLRGLLLDVRTWAREGLIDSAVAAGYYLPGGDAVSAAQALREETESKVDVWTYAWVPGTVADVEQSFAIAEKVGAKQILYWEADYIDDRGNAGELKDALRRRAL